MSEKCTRCEKNPVVPGSMICRECVEKSHTIKVNNPTKRDVTVTASWSGTSYETDSGPAIVMGGIRATRVDPAMAQPDPKNLCLYTSGGGGCCPNMATHGLAVMGAATHCAVHVSQDGSDGMIEIKKKVTNEEEVTITDIQSILEMCSSRLISPQQAIYDILNQIEIHFDLVRCHGLAVERKRLAQEVSTAWSEWLSNDGEHFPTPEFLDAVDTLVRACGVKPELPQR